MSLKDKKPSFHKDFKVPTTKDRHAAIGSFPFQHKANDSRKDMILSTTTACLSNQSSSPRKEGKEEEKHSKDGFITTTTTKTSISDLNNPKLYIPTPKSITSYAIPKPNDEMDWLCQIPEEGQTFDEYISFLTTRTTGRIRPIANANGCDILLLPIVRKGEDSSNSEASTDDKEESTSSWPADAPSLSKLVQYTQSFFDRPVRVLPNAQLLVSQNTAYAVRKCNISTNSSRAKKKQKTTRESLCSLGAFASATAKGKFQLTFPTDSSDNKATAPKTKPVHIAGRADPLSGKVQFQVASLLNELSSFRCNYRENNFCIMGITMEDLYDGPKDLFCAGMAFGGDKVAIFSFARYHPFLKMSPLRWHHYTYIDKCDGYSYFENDKEPAIQKSSSSSSNSCSLSEKDQVEYLKRSSKLLTHELGHLYGLDHCIHYKCLMNGTGHLVEDFNAPSHLCGVCLRKMQWRLGFDVKLRYQSLAMSFGEMGMRKESQWCNKQYKFLEG